MTKDEYEKYRNQAHWIALSRELRRLRKKCEHCHFPYELNVHHKTYARLGRERFSDLIVLCRSCHSREHFIDNWNDMPGFLLEFVTGSSVGKAIARFDLQQEIAREKNREREHEIKFYKERDEAF